MQQLYCFTVGRYNTTLWRYGETYKANTNTVYLLQKKDLGTIKGSDYYEPWIN